jgi:hypothetical protein
VTGDPTSGADRHTHTDRFYQLLDDLAGRAHGPRRLRDCTGRDGWPPHGVYFFFEDGEVRANGLPRVTRVGTHALTASSRTMLWTRLSQHRGRLSGANPGGGNHRGSIFRRHVGAALIQRGDWPNGLLAAWLDDNRHPEWAEMEASVEREVSGYIGAMPFLWLAVPDAAGGRAGRGLVERNSIALLSARTGGVDRPASGWLGHQAVSEKVRESGLWNVNHVDERYDPAFLVTVSTLVERTR